MNGVISQRAKPAQAKARAELTNRAEFGYSAGTLIARPKKRVGNERENPALFLTKLNYHGKTTTWQKTPQLLLYHERRQAFIMQCPWMSHIILSGGPNKGQSQLVPCGSCGICKLNRANEWAFRLKEEAKEALTSHFITLTYDDQNLPWGYDLPVLDMPEMQLFMKKVRRAIDRMPHTKYQNEMHVSQKHRTQFPHLYFDQYIKGSDKPNPRYGKARLRYYLIGEYGSTTLRPHYHILLFNCPNSIVEEFQNKYWNKGIVHIGKVTEDSVHYCAAYHVTANKKESIDIERSPEFVTMSRNPALGTVWYIKNKDRVIAKDELATTVAGGFKQKIPRIFKDKLWDENERDRLTTKLLDDVAQSMEKEYQKIREMRGAFYHKITGSDGVSYSVHPSKIIHDFKVKYEKRVRKQLTKNHFL